ncbi:MAG TPA: hypothetical protein H9781_10715 [Candidatus Oscillibacter excrementavium]|nr:hypothetical protein [Candidatus Oscillibacter excrementavium]
MTRDEYIQEVSASLKRLTKREREAIRQELDGHMEDHMESLRELGYDEQLAEERILAAMGDPAEVGRELNRQYPFRWLVVRWLAKILVFWVLLVLLALLLFEGPVSVQVSIQERYRPDMSHHYDPSGRTVAETYPEIEFQVGDDVVRVLRVCTYRSIPWGHLMAFVNLDSYDQQFMGTVGRKEMILESQSGEQGEVWIAGPYDWWNAGDGCVAIGPEDTYVTLRYDIYGESGSIQIPLPEGETP